MEINIYYSFQRQTIYKKKRVGKKTVWLYGLQNRIINVWLTDYNVVAGLGHQHGWGGGNKKITCLICY